MTESEQGNHQWRPWLLIALSFTALAFAYSTRAGFSLVMPLLEEEFGWTRSFTSTIAAAALMITALMAPFGGRLVDKQGARAVILIGMGLLSFGCFLSAVTANPWAFMIAFGGIAAAGFGLVAMHVVSAAVEQEFESNQGLATGIATSGSTAGQLLVVPLLALLLTVYDWRVGFIALGAASLVLMIGVWRWFPHGTGGRQERKQSTGFIDDFAIIVRIPAFQLLFWSFFLCGYTTSGVIETHFLPYAAYCGFGPIPSATAFGLLSAINLAGMILVGWLTDRMNRPLLLGGIYIVRGFTFILLAEVGTDIEVLFFFAIVFGLVDYSTTPVTASLIASHIGIRVMGMAFGLISAGHQIGGAVGAYFGGVLYDAFGNYDWVWWSSIGLAMLAGLLVLLMRDAPKQTVVVA